MMSTMSKILSHDINLQKEEFKRSCTRCAERVLFYFDIARSEIIIKSSSETHHIVDK